MPIALAQATDGFACFSFETLFELPAVIGINAALTFFGSGISWQGHVGGFVGGVVLAYVLAYAPRERRTTYQAAGFAGVAILVVVAFVLRTASLG